MGKYADNGGIDTGNNNAFLVKRSNKVGGGGGVQFSRDPYNPTNLHSRKVRILQSSREE